MTDSISNIHGRTVYIQYDGFEPAVGIVVVNNGSVTARFLDGYVERHIALENHLTPDEHSYDPHIWLQAVKTKVQQPKLSQLEGPASDIIGRTIIYKYPEHDAALGIVTNVKKNKARVRFVDGFNDDFNLAEMASMLMPDKKQYDPIEWIRHMKALEKHGVKSSAKRTRKQLERLEYVDTDKAVSTVLAQDKEDRVSSKRKTDWKRVRTVCAKKTAGAAEDPQVLVRWYRGGREWLPLSHLSEKAQAYARELPDCAHRVHTLPFNLAAWVSVLIKSARHLTSTGCDPSTEELILPEPLPGELLGTKDYEDLPSWVPRIIGLESAPEAGIVLEVSTVEKPFDAFNFGHERCVYCSHRLADNLESDARMNPHLAEAFIGGPNMKTVGQHCRCSSVQEFRADTGKIYRYSVRVNRLLDKQMSLMRMLLKSEEAFDADRA